MKTAGNFYNSWLLQEIVHDKTILIKACFHSSMENFFIQSNQFFNWSKMFSAEIEETTYFVSHRSCWYNLYVNTANQFSDIFPICKER